MCGFLGAALPGTVSERLRAVTRLRYRFWGTPLTVEVPQGDRAVSPSPTKDRQLTLGFNSFSDFSQYRPERDTENISKKRSSNRQLEHMSFSQKLLLAQKKKKFFSTVSLMLGFHG